MRREKLELFSYVVQHDYGHAPNPYFGVCTLARCKCREKSSQHKNIVERADVGDWIVGTGGADREKSAGNGNLVYAMRVEKKLRLTQYWSDPRFKDKKPLKNGDYAERRGDNKKPNSPFEENERFVLLSWKKYYYFGKEAGKRPTGIPAKFRPIEKKGPGYKNDFDPQFINKFHKWLKSTCRPGMHGHPWGQEFLSARELRKRKTCRSSC